MRARESGESERFTVRGSHVRPLQCAPSDPFSDLRFGARREKRGERREERGEREGMGEGDGGGARADV